LTAISYTEREREREGESWLRPRHNAGLASFPGLHAQILLLAVRKVGEGLEGFNR